MEKQDNQIKGYIYTMYAGADPGNGWVMTDPIYVPRPTMGACMPNIRRFVDEGDFIYSISGRVEGLKQYVVGGFQVAEKLHMIEAYAKLPENRMRKADDGTLRGNIIIDKNGNQLEVDYHKNYESRLENYLIGKNPRFFETQEQIEKAREETHAILKNLFGKKELDAEKVSRIIGRWRKLDVYQINELNAWMDGIKGG